MSASLVVDIDLPSISTWGGGRITPEGSLRIEVTPDRCLDGHSAIDDLARRAHAQLDQALADITTLSGGEYQLEPEVGASPSEDG